MFWVQVQYRGSLGTRLKCFRSEYCNLWYPCITTDLYHSMGPWLAKNGRNIFTNTQGERETEKQSNLVIWSQWLKNIICIAYVQNWLWLNTLKIFSSLCVCVCVNVEFCYMVILFILHSSLSLSSSSLLGRVALVFLEMSVETRWWEFNHIVWVFSVSYISAIIDVDKLVLLSTWKTWNLQ